MTEEQLAALNRAETHTKSLIRHGWKNRHKAEFYRDGIIVAIRTLRMIREARTPL